MLQAGSNTVKFLIGRFPSLNVSIFSAARLLLVYSGGASRPLTQLVKHDFAVFLLVICSSLTLVYSNVNSVSLFCVVV